MEDSDEERSPPSVPLKGETLAPEELIITDWHPRSTEIDPAISRTRRRRHREGHGDHVRGPWDELQAPTEYKTGVLCNSPRSCGSGLRLERGEPLAAAAAAVGRAVCGRWLSSAGASAGAAACRRHLYTKRLFCIIRPTQWPRGVFDVAPRHCPLSADRSSPGHRVGSLCLCLPGTARPYKMTVLYNSNQRRKAT